MKNVEHDASGAPPVSCRSCDRGASVSAVMTHVGIPGCSFFFKRGAFLRRRRSSV